MWRSPAMAAASAEALRCAGVGIDDVAHLDLYSCFASSVQLRAATRWASATTTAAAVTVTGGLPFSGGAGSDYMTHTIATMADVLRDDPGSVGLVSGVGMHMTKHVFGVYSTTPGRCVAARRPGDRRRPATDSRHLRGPGDRGRVHRGPRARRRGGVGRRGVRSAPIGRRVPTRGSTNPALLAEAEATELVGASVDLVAGEGNVNLLKR